MSKGLAIKNQVRLRNELETDRGNMVTLGDGVPVVVTEQVQPGPHRGEHLVDRGLSSILDAPDRKRPRRFVRQEDIDISQRLARLNFLMYKMPSSVVAR